MNGAFYIGGIGLASQQTALDVIANNISNMNTQAFKRSEVSFSEIMAGKANGSAGLSGVQDNMSVGGVSTDIGFALNEAGDLQTTGEALDIAISGDGFLELMGPGGATYLWRGGRMSVDDTGMLSTESGLVLKALINVPLDTIALQIDSDGVVSAEQQSSTDPIELGQVGLVRVQNSSDITRLDGALYQLNDGADVIDAAAGEDGAGLFVQGARELSNVDLNTEMVQMMIVQRAYAANAQIVQAGDQMMAIANNLRR